MTLIQSNIGKFNVRQKINRFLGVSLSSSLLPSFPPSLSPLLPLSRPPSLSPPSYRYLYFSLQLTYSVRPSSYQPSIVSWFMSHCTLHPSSMSSTHSLSEYGSVGLPIPTADGVSLVSPSITFGKVQTQKCHAYQVSFQNHIWCFHPQNYVVISSDFNYNPHF